MIVIMAKKEKYKSSKEPPLALISFKLAQEHYEALERHAEKLVDPGTGRRPSASIAARDLLVEYLKKRSQK